MAEIAAAQPARTRRGTAALVIASLSLVLSLIARGGVGYLVNTVYLYAARN
ncbi:hypothetical protein [Catellatospora sp. NPDC049133]|jgi:hypothetical protein|uniref:hypothetical protein n=1 Tax=Catellatospora sp. NPDC049133 TaxID=3155499 RepID=UPI0033D02AEF